MRGTVVRVGNIKPYVTKLAFECNKCGLEQALALTDGATLLFYRSPCARRTNDSVRCMLRAGKFESPARCENRDCRSQSFAPLRASDQTQVPIPPSPPLSLRDLHPP